MGKGTGFFMPRSLEDRPCGSRATDTNLNSNSPGSPRSMPLRTLHSPHNPPAAEEELPARRAQSATGAGLSHTGWHPLGAPTLRRASQGQLSGPNSLGQLTTAQADTPPELMAFAAAAVVPARAGGANTPNQLQCPTPPASGSLWWCDPAAPAASVQLCDETSLLSAGSIHSFGGISSSSSMMCSAQVPCHTAALLGSSYDSGVLPLLLPQQLSAVGPINLGAARPATTPYPTPVATPDSSSSLLPGLVPAASSCMSSGSLAPYGGAMTPPCTSQQVLVHGVPVAAVALVQEKLAQLQRLEAMQKQLCDDFATLLPYI